MDQWVANPPNVLTCANRMSTHKGVRNPVKERAIYLGSSITHPNNPQFLFSVTSFRTDVVMGVLAVNI